MTTTPQEPISDPTIEPGQDPDVNPVPPGGPGSPAEPNDFPPTDPEAVKQHFRLLRQGLLAWMRGETAPLGMPAHADFAAGVADVLARVLALGVGKQVLVVSSGGPIATAVSQVLSAPPETFVELNLRLRNSSVTELAFNPKRHHLVTFNTLPHLDTAETRGHVTHA